MHSVQPGEAGEPYFRGADVIRCCLRILLTFSHPDNHIAITGEPALATHAYTRGVVSPPKAFLDRQIGSRVEFGLHGQPMWPSSLFQRPFPFIALALQLATSYDPALPKFHEDMRPVPLGLAYNNNNGKYGIAVFDISDLDNVRYGIVAAGHTRVYIERIVESMEFHYDYITDMPTRTPLSARAYMAKFGYESAGHPFDRDAALLLETRPLITPEALTPVWPFNGPEEQVPDHRTSTIREPLLDQAAVCLVEDLLGLEKIDEDDHDSDGITLLMSHLAESSLLRRGVKLTLTGACSAALRHRMWFPTESLFTSRSAFFEAFPVQHLLLQKQVTQAASIATNNHTNHSNKAFFPYYLNMTDTLLRPEAFAASFLTFLAGFLLRGVDAPNGLPFLFARSAPRLDELAIRPVDSITRGGVEVALPPAENLAIPLLPFERYEYARGPSTSSQRSRDGDSDVDSDQDVVSATQSVSPLRMKELSTLDCWPLVSDLVPGSWTALVSVETPPPPVDQETRGGSHWIDDDVDEVVVCYAFVRVRDRIRPGDPFAAGAVDLVCDIAAFLQATTPSDVDVAVVEQRLAELEAWLRQKHRSLPSTTDKCLRVLGEGEARDLLSTFLEDAATYGREALRVAMQQGVF
ncbi:hypothetical protein SPI_04861 [Niveomyces insectorum RCEF 264]|uniref:Uncharacterized protein n=1 Tax=Niveomyces insectorum RCEF 264 TaxID=1081102 RepID=A0A167UXB6_9HYPO|nr:hypothetical protein SPI_04861 [Niveomyces insectorum RCEF 264]